MKAIILCLLLSLISCNQQSSCKTKVYSTVNETSRHRDSFLSADKFVDSELVGGKFDLDTISLKKFWIGFQKNIREDNKKEVINSFRLPIHLIHPVIFNFSKDCDTIAYIKNEAKYHDIDLTNENVMLHYDLMFSKYLKKAIEETNINDIVKDGYLNKVVPGIAYRFPLNEDNRMNSCYTDHAMKFNFLYEQSGWVIVVDGL